MNYLSRNLLFLRKNLKLTQAKVAVTSGVTRVTWSNYENGVTEPDIVKLIDISQYFKVSIDDILLKDISTNVHLIDNKEIKNDPKVNTVTSDEANEPDEYYEKAKKNEVELMILQLLNQVSEDVKQLKANHEKKP